MKNIAFGLVIIALILFFQLLAFGQDKVEDKEEHLTKVRFEEAQTSSLLEKVTISHSKSIKEIEALNASAEQLDRSIKRLTKEKKQLAKDLANIRESIRNNLNLLGKLKTRSVRYTEFLYYLSKQADFGNILSLTLQEQSAKSMNYIASMLYRGHKMVIESRQAYNELSADEKELSSTLDTLRRAEAELEAQQLEHKIAKQKLKEQIDKFKHDAKLYKSYLQELAVLRESLEQSIRKLEEERQQQSEQSQAIELQQKMLPPLAEGRIVVNFNEQDPRYDFNKIQRGLVIYPTERSPVKAVYGGEVIHATVMRGYGYVVIVQHRPGLHSVYGHLASIDVELGQDVATGTVLGYTGFQPLQNNYALYLEIRYNGNAQDPLDWINRQQLKLKGANSN